MTRTTHLTRISAPARRGAGRVTEARVKARSMSRVKKDVPEDMDAKAAPALKASVLDVPEHLHWFESLQSRYKWAPLQWEPISLAISRLKKRSDDSRLYLGIVGEFSSGKSTLINAFLREDLLKTDILPATTCATTVLEYGPQVDALLSLQDGSVVRWSNSGTTFWGRLRRRILPISAARQLYDARRFIHLYTAEEEHARNIQRVTVTHPNERLRSGLVIVDTPGINVENDRHAAVTRDAVKNVCDAVVVIVPAPAACSQTLVGFLKDNLADSSHRCLVFITKIDLIPARERERLVSFVSDRLQRECGTFASILSGAPCYMLNGHPSTGDPPADNPDVFRQQFIQAEEDISRILNASRKAVITEQLLIITLSIFTALDCAIRARENEYNERHQALDRNRIPDLSTFVGSHKKSYALSIKQSTSHLVRDVEDLVSEMREKLYSAIEHDILAAASQDELKSAVSAGMESRVKHAFANLSSVSTDLHQQVSQLAAGCHHEFESEFSSRYRSLTTLGGLIVIHDDTKQAMIHAQAESLHRANTSASLLVEAVNSGNTATNVGAAAGAAMGTWLIPIPVLGTLVGGGIGWVFGRLFGPSLGELQQKATVNARQTVSQWAAQCGAQMQTLVNDHVQQSIAALHAAIDRYAEVYDARVREMIKQDDEARTLLQRYLAIAEEDLADLRTRDKAARQYLDAVRISLGERKEPAT